MKLIHFYACENNFEGLLEEIEVKNIDVNLKNKKSNNTPLHYAASYGHPRIVKILLKKEADVYAQNEHLNTPFFTAVSRACMPKNEERLSDFLEVIKLLLLHEAILRRKDPRLYQERPFLKDIKDNLGYTPLTWAKRFPKIHHQLLEIIAHVEQEQNEIARQEEASRNIQPTVRLMPDSTSPVKSAYLRQRPAVASAAEEKSTEAAPPVNTDSHIKIDLSPRSWWNNVMAFLYTGNAKDEAQQPLLAERKVNTDSPTTPKHVKVQ